MTEEAGDAHEDLSLLPAGLGEGAWRKGGGRGELLFHFLHRRHHLLLLSASSSRTARSANEDFTPTYRASSCCVEKLTSSTLVGLELACLSAAEGERQLLSKPSMATLDDVDGLAAGAAAAGAAAAAAAEASIVIADMLVEDC